MQQQSIQTFEFDNGLTLLVERMPHVQSAAFAILTPAGSIYEPEGHNGTAAALCDLITRGAGDRNSRELSAALDFLGVQRGENVGWNFLSLSGAALAENLVEALPIYAEILRKPTIPEDHFPAVMSGIEQNLLSVEDEPQRKVLVELRKLCYDLPWGRPSEGTLTELPNLTHAGVVEFFQRNVRPNGTLIGVAGNVDPEEIRRCVETHFGDWPAAPEPEIDRQPAPGGVHHLPLESSQTHIGIAYDGVPYGHPDYYTAWAAVSILSGGSSSRLFTEVREKRGLCYSVYATLNSLLEEGRVLAYAGTTTERAQQTLDVTLAEMKRLGDGIGEEELQRCQARAKSALIMQQESTGSRAASIARDWFHLQRINTLDDIRDRVEKITVAQIEDYVHRHPARDFTILTIGQQPLTVNV
jgi:predicted Zn-dependent peptidase